MRAVSAGYGVAEAKVLETHQMRTAVEIEVRCQAERGYQTEPDVVWGWGLFRSLTSTVSAGYNQRWPLLRTALTQRKG